MQNIKNKQTATILQTTQPTNAIFNNFQIKIINKTHKSVGSIRRSHNESTHGATLFTLSSVNQYHLHFIIIITTTGHYKYLQLASKILELADIGLRDLVLLVFIVNFFPTHLAQQSTRKISQSNSLDLAQLYRQQQ